jgi:predicted Zn-dependent peptidase
MTSIARRAVAALAVFGAAFGSVSLAAQTPQRIVVLSEPGTPVVAAEFLLTVGPADETADLAGIAHLAARSAVSSLRADFDSMGVHLNVTSHKDGLAFSVIAAPDDWEVATGRLLEALFDDEPGTEQVARERQAIIAELAGRQSNPADAATRELDSAFFGAAHPWGRPTVGTAQSLARIRPADVAEFLTENFTPGRTIAAVVGPVNEADVRSHLLPLLGSGAPAPVEIIPFRSAERPVLREYNSITTWVAASFRFPETGDEEALRFVAHLAGDALSFSPSQRSVYDVSAEMVPRAGGGEIRIQVVVPPEEGAAWAERISDAIAAIEAGPLLDDVFESHFRRFRGESVMKLLTPEARAYAAVRHLLVHGSLDSPATRDDEMTQTRVRAAARSLNDPTVVVLGPDVESDNR